MNRRSQRPRRIRQNRFLVAVIAMVAVVTACADESTLSVSLPVIPANVVSLADFGKNDGVTLNTDAFEKALATLSEKGGGKLLVPPGIWFTGPIKLRSRTELHVQQGALILFSGDPRLYPLIVVDLKGEKEVVSISPISASGGEDIAITGRGVIDGSGDAWRPVKKDKLSEREWQSLVRSGGVLNRKKDVWYPGAEAMNGDGIVERLAKAGSLALKDYEPAHHFLRPKMVRLIGVKRLLIRDVTFRNSPMWTVNPLLCEDVSIINVQVRNPPSAQNSDALDLESCRRAIIRGCTFDTGDDGICLKSGKDEVGRRIGVPTEDVLVEDCVVYHAHGGFTIGSEMSGGVRNVRVNNCLFAGTDIGLRFKSTRGRGGVVERIAISNVTMLNIPGNAIDFNLSYGGKAPLETEAAGGDVESIPVTEKTPQFRDISIENVVCRGADRAIVLRGLPEMPLRNITLRNVSMTTRRGASVTDADGLRFENARMAIEVGPLLSECRVVNSKMDNMK